jgi:hypothetical protein
MRTTVRIDDELLLNLKEQAHKEAICLSCIFNWAFRTEAAWEGKGLIA